MQLSFIVNKTDFSFIVILCIIYMALLDLKETQTPPSLAGHWNIVMLSKCASKRFFRNKGLTSPPRQGVHELLTSFDATHMPVF